MKDLKHINIGQQNSTFKCYSEKYNNNYKLKLKFTLDFDLI